ncbi:MAG: extracellular solute-binding protein [Candidatus Schekmanbacteria bacterium]|nr:MAG: extracellular solute-binding protein [Candidatus Schekmanbacteria bacterium]
MKATSGFKMILLVLSLVISLSMFVSVKANAETHLKMSTTTSTENSGLLSVLIPPFEKKYGVKVDIIAVGTGAALKLGKNGDVDVVFVHSRPDEDRFVKEGYGVYRQDVMHNDFVILGPEKDPAKIKGSSSAIEAFKKIAGTSSSFVSRGDNSGTHKKEMAIWKSAGIQPSGKWYIEAGQGMGAVLKIADEKRAYTLSDRGTYLAYSDKIDLKILYEGDKILYNPYGIIAVNPKKYPYVKFELAKKLIDYITGPEGQEIIKNYKIKGQQLFFPDAIK